MDKDKKEDIDTELEKVGITLSTETLHLLSSQVSEAIINSDISNKVLVTATDIARMMSYKPFSSAMRKIIESPDFPKPFSIVGGGNNKWLKSQVEDWILKKYEESSSQRRSAIFRTR